MVKKIDKTIQIADTIHGSIRLNSIEKQIISTPIFNRLHNISQNSTAYLTFPTNRTKRFEHSIGTMQLCGDMFMASIANGESNVLDDFFSGITDIILNQIEKNLNNYTYYKGKIGDRNFVEKEIIKNFKSIKINKEYNRVIPINVDEKHRCVYIIIYQSIRLGALLHDVGHPPYSHITEFALKDIWTELSKKESLNTREFEYISIMENYFKSKGELHEKIGNKITDKVMESIIEFTPDSKFKDKGKDLYINNLFKIIVSEITLAILEEKLPIFADIHSIIDGTVDGDRLDYVSRDLINSGLNVGCIEYDRIIESMRLVKENENFLFIPSSKNIDSIEDFFNRRWKLYKQIVYHHRVIKTDQLLQDCIKELTIAYLNEDNVELDYGNINDSDSRILEYDISSIWKAIEDRPSYSYFFDKLIQWDDGWLMAILKKYYFDKYLDEDDIIAYKLEELIANKKYYYSIIKRMEDFIAIDKSIAKEMKNAYSSIKNLLSQNSEKKTFIVEGEEKIEVSVERLFKVVSDFWEDINCYDVDREHIPTDGFILRKISKIYDNMFYEGWLEDIILENVKNIKEDPTYDIKDMFACIKKIKLGIKGGKNAKTGGLGVYTTSKSEVNSFLELSNIGKNLTMESNFMPVFYLYIYKSDQNETKDYDKIKKDLGKIIGSSIVLKIQNKLEELIGI